MFVTEWGLLHVPVLKLHGDREVPEPVSDSVPLSCPRTTLVRALLYPRLSPKELFKSSRRPCPFPQNGTRSRGEVEGRRGKGNYHWAMMLEHMLEDSGCLSSRPGRQPLRREPNVNEVGDSKGNKPPQGRCRPTQTRHAQRCDRSLQLLPVPEDPAMASRGGPPSETYLVDFILRRFQGLDNGFQLNFSSLNALLQLGFFLLQSVQLQFGPVQVIFLGLEVRFLRLDLGLQ